MVIRWTSRARRRARGGTSRELARSVHAWQAGAMESMPWDKYLRGARFDLRTHYVLMSCPSGQFILTEDPEHVPRGIPTVTPEELRTLARSLGAGKALDPASSKLILDSKRVLGASVVGKEDELHGQGAEETKASRNVQPVRAQSVRDDRGPAVLLTAQQSARARSSGAPSGQQGTTQQGQFFS